MRSRRLRICIDARATPQDGGVREALMGLASGLSGLEAEPEEYLFLVYEDGQEWLRPYVPDPRNLLTVPLPKPSTARRLLRAGAGRSSALRRLAARSTRTGTIAVPRSDGTVERAEADVVHLAIPFGFRTHIPTVYQVYDLQHLHFPQYFHQATLLRREVAYRALCQQAAAVTTLTHWGKLDVVDKYGLDAKLVTPVGLASMLSAYPEPTAEGAAELRERFSLPSRFALFPANTWPHKNHLGLLEALALLREQGLSVPVVCCGAKTDFFKTIDARARELALTDTVLFLGHVQPAELRTLYQLSHCVVFPTKFEGWGMPLTEAFAAGRPAACSAIPPLLEQGGDAAMTFDPDDPVSIADGIAKIWTDEAVRQDLIDRGAAKAASVSWETTARVYRALYRRAGGQPLTDEDLAVLGGTRSSLAAT